MSSRKSSSNPQHISHDHSVDTRSHFYSSGTPSGGMSPQSPSSPLSLPPLLPDDADDGLSPAGSFIVFTPVSTSPVGPRNQIASDHCVLASMAQMPTPTFGSPGDEYGQRHSFPLLPPHHPLRKKLSAVFDREGASPPHTPKGHPLESKTHFPFSAKARMLTITNPYHGSKQSYPNTLAYLLRVPRRLRPVFLIGFCFISFALVLVNNSMSRSSQMDSILKQQRQMHSRRFIPIDGLLGINDRRNQALMGSGAKAREAESAVQSAWSPPSNVETLAFASTQDEFAALISFITSTTANVLPSLDPSVPLEPSIVLDFDPSRPSARDDLDLLVTEISTIFPVVLMGKMRDPWLREVKKMLAEFKITPPPLVIDIDQRRDHATFIPLIARLIGTTELPQLLLQGKSLGSYHDGLVLRDAGTARSTIEASGVVSMREAKKKKKGVKERERIENERILGPAPIVDAT